MPIIGSSIRVLEPQGPCMHVWIYGPWVPGPLGNPSNMRWLTLGKAASIKEAAFGRLTQRGRAAPFVGILYGGWLSQG